MSGRRIGGFIKKTRPVSSIEEFNTRSLEVQRSSADNYVSDGSHDSDAICFCDSAAQGEVRGEGAARVGGPVRSRRHRPGQHTTPHARRDCAPEEPVDGQYQHFAGGPLYGPTAL